MTFCLESYPAFCSRFLVSSLTSPTRRLSNSRKIKKGSILPTIIFSKSSVPSSKSSKLKSDPPTHLLIPSDPAIPSHYRHRHLPVRTASLLPQVLQLWPSTLMHHLLHSLRTTDHQRSNHLRNADPNMVSFRLCISEQLGEWSLKQQVVKSSRK